VTEPKTFLLNSEQSIADTCLSLAGRRATPTPDRRAVARRIAVVRHRPARCDATEPDARQSRNGAAA